ncbi:MAG TPA: hypothetical protein VNK03_07475 [Gammaproteobacteria bacterium]|nr:hypothetical protein [Gammaproteobacteria bacterium]
MANNSKQNSFFSKYGNFLIVGILAFLIGNWVGSYRATISAKEAVTKKVVEQIEKGINAIKN